MRLLTGLLCALLLLPGVAASRESCPFQRDPAFLARVPVAPAAEGELAIATQNLFRLFDDEQDGDEQPLTTAQFRARIDRIARYVVRDLGTPPVLAVQEIEDETSLKALAAALGRDTGRGWRYVIGEASGDGDIRSGLLLDARLRVVSVASLFARTPRAGKPLHDRLPLVVELDAGRQGRITVVVVHMKSLIDSDSRDADRAAKVNGKRMYQAEELARWLQGPVAAGKRIVVLGDFNGTLVDDDPVRAGPMKALLSGSGLVDVAGRFLKPSQRWTYRHGCQLNELDHALVSPVLAKAVSGYAIARGDTCLRARGKCDKEASVSDHEGVVLRLR